MKKFFLVMILLATAQLVLAVTPSQKIPDQSGEKNLRKYLCVTDATAAGIEYKASQESWLPTIFVTGDRYIVFVDIRTKDNKMVTTVMPYGDAVPYWFCSAKVASGALLCSGKSSLFVFNEKTLRFIETFFDGYVDGVNDNLNKPYIVVGNCTRL